MCSVCFLQFIIKHGAPLVAWLGIRLQCRRPWLNSWVGKMPWRRDMTPVFLGFPAGSDSKESACNAGDLGSIPASGRSPGGGHGNSLQYSCLEKPQGQKSLVSYCLWGRKESDTTKWLSPQHKTWVFKSYVYVFMRLFFVFLQRFWECELSYAV